MARSAELASENTIHELTVLSSDETILEGVSSGTSGDDSTTGHCNWFGKKCKRGSTGRLVEYRTRGSRLLWGRWRSRSFCVLVGKNEEEGGHRG
jgi:hypothetical protein